MSKQTCNSEQAERNLHDEFYTRVTGIPVVADVAEPKNYKVLVTRTTTEDIEVVIRAHSEEEAIEHAEGFGSLAFAYAIAEEVIEATVDGETDEDADEETEAVAEAD